MRYLTALLILPFIFSCKSTEQPKKLEEAFILALQKNDFNLLNDFLPDKAFYTSLGDKMPKRTDEEIREFLHDRNDEIKQAWQNTIFNAAQKKIDLDKVVIKEVILYDPFRQDEISEAMVINYEYKGSTWDDIQFIVSRHTGKTYLLNIPNPTRAFSMIDTELRATNEARAWMEMQKPEFKKDLVDLSAKIIDAVKADQLDEFGKYIIYRGDNENRRWKTAINMNDSTERKLAAMFLERVKANVQDCETHEIGDIMTERESEGVWIVLPMKCEKKVISLAYLRINGRLLLGDSEAEAAQ